MWRKVVSAAHDKYNFAHIQQERSKGGSTENVTSILVLKFKISLDKLHSKDLKNLYVQEILKKLKKEKRYKNIYL